VPSCLCGEKIRGINSADDGIFTAEARRHRDRTMIKLWIFTTKTPRHKDLTKVEPSDYDTVYSPRLCVSVVNIFEAIPRVDMYFL
jgi:hypothetical protein